MARHGFTHFVLALIATLALCGSTCGEKAPVPEPVKDPEPRPIKPLPAVTPEGKVLREVKADKYTLKLDLSGQILSISMSKDESWREPGEFRPGDTVRVTSSSAELKVTTNVVATVPSGTLLGVSNVQKDWLEANVIVQGRPVRGWINRKDVKFDSEEGAIRPTLATAGIGDCVPAALLIQKAKQFDDGLYAAVELAAQSGSGNFAGKRKLLERLSVALASLDQTDEAAQIIFGAAKLGGQQPALNPAAASAVQGRVDQFLRDPLQSKPLAFYTWTRELSAIFQQDRLLQQPLKGDAGIAALLGALKEDEAARTTYLSYLQLVSRLTNPLTKPTLREMLNGAAEPPPEMTFFPPSRSHETELVMRLYGDKPIPEGFDLADELIRQIKAGSIELKPTPDSGWYDYQTWAIEPFVLPEQMPESAKLKTNDEYRKQLLDLFKGTLALTRETHIKQLEVPRPASEAPGDEPKRPMVYVSPELAAEPLATFYLRRAEVYRFVRKVLTDTFGEEALGQLRRQTAAGPVAMPLAVELSLMEAVFDGASLAVSRQLGKANLAEGESPEAALPKFQEWASRVASDPDVGRDARMMVPVFYDLQRKKTKVWVFLGWTERWAYVNFDTPPAVEVIDASGKVVPEDKGPIVNWNGSSYPLLYPVVAEVYVTQILNRDEFRRHCDAYRTRAAILANLK